MPAARLIIMGAPGSGKGTHAEGIAALLRVPTISTGELFRDEIAAGSELGREVRSTLLQGDLVSDELVSQLVDDRLSQPDVASGFVLDGYPRSAAQLVDLDRILARDGLAIDTVVLLEIDPDEIVARLVARADEQGRADDTEDVIRHRIGVYDTETAPLEASYAERGILLSVDSGGPLDEARARVTDALARFRPISSN